MSLTIHWAQGMAANSPFAHGLVTAEQTGKLNIASAMPVQESYSANKVDALSVADSISKENFLAILRDNLLRLEMKDAEGENKDVEPLLNAFAQTINKLEEAYGKSVADMAMNYIARAIESGGASDANMTGVLSSVFNQIALDPTLKGKNSDLTQKLTGKTPAQDDDWWAGGLVRILNTGSRFGQAGEGGLAKALSDFYGNEAVEVDRQGIKYISASSAKKFALSWSEKDQAYGIKLLTTEYNRIGGPSEEHSSAKGKYAGYRYGREIFFPPEAIKQEDGSYEVESEWEMAYMQAEMMLMTQLRPGMGRFELTTGIIDGSIKYKPTEKMLEYEDLFIRKKLENAKAWADAMRFAQPYFEEHGLNYINAFLTSASEEEKAAYSAAMDNYMQISKQNEKELYELKQEIFGEFLGGQ